MAQAYKRLTADGVQIAVTAGSIYTVAASTTAYIKKLILHNTSEFSENVLVYLIEDGGSVSSSRLILNKDLPGYDSYDWAHEFPLVLQAGESLFAVTDTASTVNALLFGREDT